MNNSHRGFRALTTFAVAAAAIMSGGCLDSADTDVVVYTALDQEFSDPVFEDFTERTGVVVRAKFDAESTKTVNLVNGIISEQNRQRCHVFWNNEILHTLRLKKMGLLDVYVSPAGENFPSEYRSADGDWYGFGARARVLIVNTELVGENERPKRIQDLIDAKWKGKVGIAKPLFGTTATHCAVLYSTWGRERAEAFFLAIKANARIVSGNRQVAMDVANKQLAFGLTDTDDAIIELEKGKPVQIIYPNQADGDMGTLFIPNTVSIIKGSGENPSARKLVDYLLSPEVERNLAKGRSAQFPISEAVKEYPRVRPSEPVRWMSVDFQKAADQWEPAARFLRDNLATAE